MSRQAWIDAGAGVAGDMLLGALLDAGADLAAVQGAVDAVIPGSVAISLASVHRAGMRATKAEVEPLVDDPPHRTWATIRRMITDAALDPDVRDRALAVFHRLAEAEGRVHGVPAEQVHFHEVGALDSIADVLGVCAALGFLGVGTVVVSPIAVGSGEIAASHGRIPVPVPAVVELSRGWPIRAGGTGELTTPTGMALVTTLAAASSGLPEMQVEAVGVGAGSKDTPGRANVTRVIIGDAAADAADPAPTSVLIEANVDDLDPRLWPEVLARLMAAGADDAWLTPILMKKGRPAHTLSVLADPARAGALRAVVLGSTSSIGVRQSGWIKYALPRLWRTVRVGDDEVRIKVAHLDGVITQVSAEFEDVARLAAALTVSEQQVLHEALAAAAAAGLRIGSALP